MRYAPSVIKQCISRVRRVTASPFAYFTHRLSWLDLKLLSLSLIWDQKMTPLPRWVLLVPLLAVAVAAHPVEHACVRLCRARYTSPESAGVCEHQQRPVLQSAGGRFTIERLFRLCLTPCHSDSQSFDTTEACLAFRDSLIRRLGCYCNSTSHDGNLEVDQMKGAGTWKMLRKRADEEEVVAHSRHRPELVGLSERIAETMAGDSEDSARGNLKTGSPMAEATDETSVDWEMWCATQCDNGQGGSACHCDIIP